MRLPNTEHISRPGRIHEIAGDFKLEDVWALPTPGGPDDLGRLVRQITSDDESDSRMVRTLFAIRWKLGALQGSVPAPEHRLRTRVHQRPHGKRRTRHRVTRLEQGIGP